MNVWDISNKIVIRERLRRYWNNPEFDYKVREVFASWYKVSLNWMQTCLNKSNESKYLCAISNFRATFKSIRVIVFTKSSQYFFYFYKKQNTRSGCLSRIL